MSGFSADWLALREPADKAARDRSPIGTLVGNWAVQRATAVQDPSPLRIVDLGSGSGANLRYLAPRLGRAQSWRLVENDAALLAHSPRVIRDWARAHSWTFAADAENLYIESPGFSATVAQQPLDLATQLERLTLRDADLVTASALLDLVSHAWIDSLLAGCHSAGCAVLLALSYDGRIIWRPGLAFDDTITAVLNRHQHGDKGFGPAAGPQAAAYANERLRQAGYIVRQGRSDWRLTAADAPLQAVLAKGWAEAATETAPADGARIGAWLKQRRALIERAACELTVGHVDLFALPRTQ